VRVADAVAVVTDSTADLPPDVAAELAISIVPLHVDVTGRPDLSGTELSSVRLAEVLRSHGTVTTSRPTPAEFSQQYEALLAAGHQRVVSIHLSGELSGTCESARFAAAHLAGGAVSVVDSRLVGMGLGLTVISAAQAAWAGASVEQVRAEAARSAQRCQAFFYVDSLEWLRRGGRISAAAAMVGTALAVKPLLHFVDGRILALEKVRTSAKAIARLVALAQSAASGFEVDVAVQHLANPARADQVCSHLRAAVPQIRYLYLSEVGAVVAAHVGPGLIGVAIRRV
jgi:DegV family protein with EDD domain